MKKKPTKGRVAKKPTVSDLRQNADKAANVKGGVSKASISLHEAACKGTHLPEVVIEVW